MILIAILMGTFPTLSSTITPLKKKLVAAFFSILVMACLDWNDDGTSIVKFLGGVTLIHMASTYQREIFNMVNDSSVPGNIIFFCSGAFFAFLLMAFVDWTDVLMFMGSAVPFHLGWVYQRDTLDLFGGWINNIFFNQTVNQTEEGRVHKRWTKDEKEMVKEMKRKGIPQAKICQEMDMKKQTVSNILKKK